MKTTVVPSRALLDEVERARVRLAEDGCLILEPAEQYLLYEDGFAAAESVHIYIVNPVMMHGEETVYVRHLGHSTTTMNVFEALAADSEFEYVLEDNLPIAYRQNDWLKFVASGSRAAYMSILPRDDAW